MRSATTKWILPILLVALLPMTACDGADIGGTSDGVARLSVYLTDAPGDVKAVWVEIESLLLHSEDGHPYELLDQPTELIPLSELVGTSQLLVADAEVDPAVYHQLRMRVGDAVLESTEGMVYVKGEPNLLEIYPEGAPERVGDLQCPSCSQSGLKVTIPRMDLPEGATALVLDFDVAQSFGHKAGKSGKWVMHPVIHGILNDTYSIEGTVTLDLPEGESLPLCPPEGIEGSRQTGITDFVPTATPPADGGEDIVRSGEVIAVDGVDWDGEFRMDYLAPGTYTMGHAALQLDGYDLTFVFTVVPAEVTVGEGIFGDPVSYTITSATCAEASGG